MSKTLQVIEPFFTLSVGDTLELSKDGKRYVNVRSNEFNKAGKDGEDYSSSFESTITLSVAYAKELLEDGYVCEVANEERNFVNVFTEIDNLLEKYNNEIASLDKTMSGAQECVKLERFTVLRNLITLLTYLKGLKK